MSTINDLLVQDGTSNGVLIVADTGLLASRESIFLSSDTQPTQEIEIVATLSKSAVVAKFIVDEVASDLSSYLVSDNAKLSFHEEDVVLPPTTPPVLPPTTLPVVLYSTRGNPVPSSPFGAPILSVTKNTEEKSTLYSYDWTDKTTWYGASIRVENEIPAGHGAGLFSLAHEYVIDTFHGKVSQEDFLLDSNGNSYRLSVKVNGVSQTEQNPHDGSGGDFVVDYNEGTIQFNVGKEPIEGDIVEVTYHYATSSVYIIKPSPGYFLLIDSVECQFSQDVVFLDTIRFQAMGPAEIFAPQLGLPSGSLIPLSTPVVYKGMRDIYNDSNLSYAPYPPLGGPSWRGNQQPTITCAWNYVGATVLKSSLGIQIHLFLEHDRPFGGEYASATFYCTQSKES